MRAPIALALALLCVAAPAFAARPLLDQHQWDKYFALFAPDANVPWKPTTLRLDTYSGAPIDFAAYAVDPADVIVAGPNRAARPLDTSHRRPVARWRFSPPRGYRFQASDVSVPLGTQEGFYVVEARRGDAVQQVWLNRSHVGLLTHASATGLQLWGVNLRSGRALANMRVSFLVGARLVERRTGSDGLILWRDRQRPTFALAESGPGRAFVSILPEPPPPTSILAVRLASGSVRAGGRVRFVGFARRRSGSALRRASGDVRVSVVGRGSTLATTGAPLDPAGAFSGELAIPAGVDSGEYAVLASGAGGVGGTSVHVDAASDVTLAVTAACPCDAERDVPLEVSAQRADLPAPDVAVSVRVVRSPHVVPPGSNDAAPRWGTTVVLDRTVRTNAEGRARVTLSSPSDGLDSTYGIRATTRGASASVRVVVPVARVALALEPAQASADVGAPIAFDVRGFDASGGEPAANLAVRVRLSHGAAVQAQTVKLDEHGHGHVVFRQPRLGSNLALAEADVDGRHVLDAAAVLVEPTALSGRIVAADAGVAVTLDRHMYPPGGRAVVHATAAGARGDALLALAGDRTYATRVAPVAHGDAATTFDLGDPQGDVRVDAAFVRDGALALGSTDLPLAGPGRADTIELAPDRALYGAGDIVHVTVRDGDPHPAATLAVRLSDARESGPADFTDAPGVLATGATSEQATGSADPAWHGYVAPARSKASDIFAAERPRKVASEVPTLGAAAARTDYWHVERVAAESFDVPVPAARGHYVLSVLRIADDGDVGAASTSFDVQ